MKIGIEIPDECFKGVDLSSPENGNPVSAARIP